MINKNKIVVIIQARMNSKRLPGKVLAKIQKKPSILFMIERVQKAKLVDEIWVATSTNLKDDILVDKLKNKNVYVFRGQEYDVLDRYYKIALKSSAKTVIRLTGDCPFIDSALIDKAIEIFEKNDADYLSNHLERTFPDGQDIEIFNFKTLKTTREQAEHFFHKEHVTSYMHGKRGKKFGFGNFKRVPFKNKINWSHIRMTLDEPEDLFVLNKLSKKLKTNFTWMDVVNEFSKQPELLNIMSKFSINEGSNFSLKQKSKNEIKFHQSNKKFKTISKKIPIASQTFSKSHMQWVKGVTPLFVNQGKGCIIKDIDNNEYIDYVMGLMPIILGYADPDVNLAIQNQLEKGITFSMPSLLEEELSDLLIKYIPCAEMVRFGKNGSDATTGAIRLARAFTKKEHIIMMGYHGWHDWSIGTTSRNLGVPDAVRRLTHKSSFNKIEELSDYFKKFKNKIAGVILEPDSVIQPLPDFLSEVKNITERNGSLLIFDEVISGFRTHIGGAQKYYGVTPDLACFGKAMANGMPLSALVGRADIMLMMKDIFYSGTFGGETLSLAASIATIKKLKLLNVSEKIWKLGSKLRDNLNFILKEKKLDKTLSFQGAGW